MNTKKPYISVIIITYKNVKDTVKSVKSVLKQKYKDYEIIVVDDNSPDDTAVQIKKAVPTVKIVRLKKPLGRAAMNEGMKRAKGEVFLLLDADMYLSKNFLEHLAEKFQKFPTINATAFHLKDPTGKTAGWEPIYAIEKTPEGGHETMTATFAIRREVFKKVGGFNPDFFLYVEYEYYLSLLKKGYIVQYFPDLIAYHANAANPYRSVMNSYHVVKNHMQMYAIHLPIYVWPKFLLHHNKEFGEVMVTGKANRWGTVKGLLIGIYFFFRALPKRNVLRGEALKRYMRFYFPKRGDIVIKKWGWGKG